MELIIIILKRTNNIYDSDSLPNFDLSEATLACAGSPSQQFMITLDTPN